MAARSPNPEWTQYYRVEVVTGLDILHAHFVGHRYPRHSHEYAVVGLVKTGAQSYAYRGSRHVTPAGQVFVVNPGEPHTGESACDSGYVYQTLYLGERFFENISGHLGMPKAPASIKGAVLDDPLLSSLLTRFHNAVAMQTSRFEKECLLFEALARLFIRHAEAHSVPFPKRKEGAAVSRARDYMEEHFNADISLETLARFVRLNPYYFAHAFERATGVPPHAYVEGIRMRKARELLDRATPIVDTALAVGYADQSHFTKRFKRFLGITPGQYVHAGIPARRARIDAN